MKINREKTILHMSHGKFYGYTFEESNVLYLSPFWVFLLFFFAISSTSLFFYSYISSHSLSLSISFPLSSSLSPLSPSILLFPMPSTSLPLPIILFHIFFAFPTKVSHWPIHFPRFFENEKQLIAGPNFARNNSFA